MDDPYMAIAFINGDAGHLPQDELDTVFFGQRFGEVGINAERGDVTRNRRQLRACPFPCRAGFR